MAKVMKSKKHKVAPKKVAVEAKKVVLVGTYKSGQLEKWPGFYNYPICDGDKIESEFAKRVNEIWLFNAKKEPVCLKAKFVGFKTREELKSEFGYPAKGKPHGTGNYILYATSKTRIYNPASGLAEKVIVRLQDFATSKSVQKRLRDYLSSPDRKDPLLANYLPPLLSKIPPEVLRVCEAAVQLDFYCSMFAPVEKSLPNGEKAVISMFSGAMGLDNGIEQAGMKIRLCVEIQHAMAETIRANKPDIPLIEDDVRNYSGGDLRARAGLSRDDDVFLVCGGPPCQAFSTAGKRLGFDDDRGNVFLKYLDLIGEIRPKYFLLENVRGLLSAAYSLDADAKESKPSKGTALLYALEKIKSKGYSATFTLYDSANYGVPQRRERVIILGSRDGYKIPLIPPTHSSGGERGLAKWRTFRDAVRGVRECNAAPIPQRRIKFFRMLGPGQCWKDLPQKIQKEAMGKSFALPGGKTGFYRRLAWDEPSPTLVTCPTMPATDLMHPVEDRALSVEEYARIQMFPDKWVFKGRIADIYKQIGNAVPVGMGYAAARHLLWFDSLPEDQKRKVELIDPNAVYSRYKNTNFLYFEKLKSNGGH